MIFFVLLVSGLYFGSQIFAFKGQNPLIALPGLSPPQVANATNTTTNTTGTTILPGIMWNPKGFIQWIIDKIGWITDYIGAIITKYIQGLFPGATSLLGTLIFTLAIIAVIYWKAEFFSTALRTILIVIVGVLLIGIALSILGILG